MYPWTRRPPSGARDVLTLLVLVHDHDLVGAQTLDRRSEPRTVLRGQLGQLTMVTLPRLPMLPFGLGPLGEQGVRPVGGDALAALSLLVLRRTLGAEVQ